ncbi:MAG: FAD:protein FMN transferase [Candidatus Omnitrophica bacterium]|nr:FAD:protein FMN transferase [Candidatus Omnitrophota bacterium]
MRKIFYVIIAALAIGLSVRACDNKGPVTEKTTRLMMDTYVTITAVGPRQSTSKAINLALNRMQEISVKFNSLDKRSPIYAFNDNETPITDPELLSVIKKALEISRESEGAFDITVAPLLELWGFYDKKFRVPDARQIKDCLARIGYRHLSIDNGKLIKDNAGVKIDLGGIGKGYAISEAVKVLKKNGVNSALIDCGGDVYALGKKRNRSWRIGIKDPRGEGIVGYIDAEDTAVMSSGDYERFFLIDGRLYHHIFNPMTGYPTEGISGVTVIYKDPVIAQPWTKAPFVLGPRKSMQLFNDAGVDAMVITDSGEKLYTPDFRAHRKNSFSLDIG